MLWRQSKVLQKLLQLPKSWPQWLARERRKPGRGPLCLSFGLRSWGWGCGEPPGGDEVGNEGRAIWSFGLGPFPWIEQGGSKSSQTSSINYSEASSWHCSIGKTHGMQTLLARPPMPNFPPGHGTVQRQISHGTWQAILPVDGPKHDTSNAVGLKQGNRAIECKTNDTGPHGSVVSSTYLGSPISWEVSIAVLATHSPSSHRWTQSSHWALEEEVNAVCFTQEGLPPQLTYVTQTPSSTKVVQSPRWDQVHGFTFLRNLQGWGPTLQSPTSTQEVQSPGANTS